VVGKAKHSKTWGGVLLVAVSIMVLFLLFLFDPANHFFPKCPFYGITGLYCPGCGSQRAIHALLHGQIANAAGQNLLLLLMLPLLGWHALVWLYNKRSSKSMPLLFRHQVKAWWILVVVIVFWVLRNIPAKPFSILAPDIAG